MSIESLGDYTQWHPTLANRFKFRGFHFLSNQTNALLTLQTVSASFEFDSNLTREYDDGQWTVTITIEDNASGGVTNAINSIVPRFNKRHNTTFMEFDVMDESDNLRSILHLENVRLVNAKFDFDYANSLTAKWILTFNAHSLQRIREPLMRGIEPTV